MRELNGKTAIVTGSSRGIGAATARELARHGVTVILVARSLQDIEEIASGIRDEGGAALAQTCDVTRFSDVSAAVALCREQFNGLDILVNNAGLIEPIARLADSDPASWCAAADVNYKGVYHGLRAALPVMLEQGTGVVVNISSGAATGSLEGWSHYNSSKAAALSLTRCADAEYRDHGVRVVGFSPGTVATGMQVAIKASGLNPVSQLDPSVHSDPARPARIVAWLCTNDAREFAGIDVSIHDETIRRRAGLAD